MQKSKIGWKFEHSESGDAEGLNDGGVEAFRDDHLLSLAKESAQNSLDAIKDKSRPVTLEFKTLQIEQKDFPDIENFKKIIDLQLKYWKKAEKDKSSVVFFEEAKKILDSKKILCLRISDFNTTGLDGSKEGKERPFSRWFKLVRSRGVTDNDALAGGSFGLGKFASFACSKLRTVFYSTMDHNSVDSHQGVSILASYDREDGERTKSRGYFCNLEDFSCIGGGIKLDKNFSRESPGTDIYIIGFVDTCDEEELEDRLFSSILRSFLLAIFNGNLIFRFNGKNLEKRNLEEVIEKYRDVIYRPIVPKEIIEHYDVLAEKLESKEYLFSIMEKEDVSLKIAVGPELSKKIGMFRNNGMKIFDKKNIRSFNDFTGLLNLKNDAINAYFRKLENPQHDNWRPERSNNPQEARDIIKKLFDQIARSIKDLENKKLPESENVEGLSSLSDEEFDEQGSKPLEGLDFKPLKIIESKTKRRPIKKIKVRVSGGGRSKNHRASENGNSRGIHGPGENEEIDSFNEVISAEMKIFRDHKGVYNLFFMIPDDKEYIKCELLISGEDLRETAKISEASQIKENKIDKLRINDNIITIQNVKKNENTHIAFKLDEDENLPLEVNLYED